MKGLLTVIAMIVMVAVTVLAYQTTGSVTKECLIANEIDTNSLTGSHLTVEILEETKLWYVTGKVWDHLNHEWTDMDYRIIDKERAPQYVTKALCPE